MVLIFSDVELVKVAAHSHLTYRFQYNAQISDFSHASLYSEFLGANEFYDRPFIFMAYVSLGNARDYV